MPHTVRSIRHNDRIPFRPLRTGESGAKRLRDTLAGFRAITAAAKGLSGPGVDDIAGHMERAAERHRAVRDAQVATTDHGGSAVWVHDNGGKRIRPMTPADLQALADAHYGRGR